MRTLKIKPLRKYLSGLKRPIVEVLGLRKYESRMRLAIYKDLHELAYSKKDGAFVWLPIINFRDSDVKCYIRENKLPVNPVYKKLGIAGDCLCMACGNPKKEIPLLKIHFPEAYQRLLKLFREVNRTRRREEKITLKGYFDLEEFENKKQTILDQFNGHFIRRLSQERRSIGYE